MKSSEKPLFPAVVINIARGDLPAPVVAEPKAHELFFHLRYVGPCPGRGMYGVLYRCVLCGQTKGVPSDWVENVKAPGSFKSRDDVSDRVVSHVSHVDSARRVGKHLKDVILFPGGFLGDPVDIFLRPGILPFFLDFPAVCILSPCVRGKRLADLVARFSQARSYSN